MVKKKNKRGKKKAASLSPSSSIKRRRRLLSETAPLRAALRPFEAGSSTFNGASSPSPSPPRSRRQAGERGADRLGATSSKQREKGEPRSCDRSSPLPPLSTKRETTRSESRPLSLFPSRPCDREVQMLRSARAWEFLSQNKQRSSSRSSRKKRRDPLAREPAAAAVGRRRQRMLLVSRRLYAAIPRLLASQMTLGLIPSARERKERGGARLITYLVCFFDEDGGGGGSRKRVREARSASISLFSFFSLLFTHNSVFLSCPPPSPRRVRFFWLLSGCRALRVRACLPSLSSALERNRALWEQERKGFFLSSCSSFSIAIVAR